MLVVMQQTHKKSNQWNMHINNRQFVKLDQGSPAAWRLPWPD